MLEHTHTQPQRLACCSSGWLKPRTPSCHLQQQGYWAPRLLHWPQQQQQGPLHCSQSPLLPRSKFRASPTPSSTS